MTRSLLFRTRTGTDRIVGYRIASRPAVQDVHNGSQPTAPCFLGSLAACVVMPASASGWCFDVPCTCGGASASCASMQHALNHDSKQVSAPKACQLTTAHRRRRAEPCREAPFAQGDSRIQSATLLPLTSTDSDHVPCTSTVPRAPQRPPFLSISLPHKGRLEQPCRGQHP